jgi:hypothetical protein
MPRNRNERSWLALFRTGIWKLRELRSGKKGEWPHYQMIVLRTCSGILRRQTDIEQRAITSGNGGCWLKKCGENCGMKSDVSRSIVVEL